MTDLMAVKFVDGSDSIIEGLAIPFGGPIGGKDLTGEDFGPDTDFVFDLYPSGRPLLYDHGTDETMKVSRQGYQIDAEITDEGVWAKVQLDKSARYHATVAKMIAAGKMFFSSATMPWMKKVDANGHITQWPWMELSLTPTPANPNAILRTVKSVDYIERMVSAGEDVPPAIKSAIEGEIGSDAEPFALLADRISVSLDAFANRAELRRDWRASKGRGISAANRAEIAEVVESLRPFGETFTRLTELLARTDPEVADAAAKAEARAIEAEYLRLESRRLGVAI